MLFVGIIFDRRGHHGDLKWYAIVIGMLFITWFNKDLSTDTIVKFVLSDNFWKPLILYIVVGLLYSAIEFTLYIRRSARNYKSAWEEKLTSLVKFYKHDSVIAEEIKFSEAINQATSGEISAIKTVEKEILNFIWNNQEYSSIVQLAVGKNYIPEPHINKIELSKHIGSWTLFWPLYAISLIFDDLLTEIFNKLSEFVVRISDKFVKSLFKDVFKL